MAEPSWDEVDAALAAAVVEHFEDAQVPFLRRLVEQPSCSREPEDVELAARILDDFADELGLVQHTHVDPEGFFAAHRVYETPDLPDDARTLALVGHVDTVFPRSMGFFGFERDDDVARGPGVLDMKSGLSSILFALAAIRATEHDLYDRLRLRVVIVTDEEVGSPSSRPLLEALAPALTGALVFEKGRAEDRLVTRRKGTGTFMVTATGRGAHAGLAHERGINAIEALAFCIPRVERLTDYERGVTINVGLVEGGTSKNTVPEQASCTIDARFERPEDGPRIEARLRETVEGTPLPDHLAGARLELAGGFHRPPMVATDASRDLMRRYAVHAAAVGLSDGEAPLQGGGSDANLLSAAGVPCIDGLGPWGEGAHRTSEWCSLDSLRRRTDALARFLVRDATGPLENPAGST